MHIERIFVLAGSILGMIAAFLPWRHAFIFTFNGTDFWGGWIAVTVFLIIAVMALIGKKAKSIDKGAPKVIVMALSALLLVFLIVLISMQMVNRYDSPGYGLYLSLVAALITLFIPVFIKDSGEFHIPTADEVKAEIEENVEVFEDQAEEVADKIEDKFEELEDRFDKDDDDESSEEE